MAEITIIAELMFAHTNLEHLTPEFEKIIAGSRKEEGNLGYELKQDINNPRHFFFIEKWASEEAIEKHKAQAHFQNFFKAIAGKVERDSITLLKNYL